MGSRRSALALAVTACRALLSTGTVTQCPGSLTVTGYGPVQVVATQWNQPGMRAGPVRNVGGNILPEMWGRAYFAQGCSDGTYNNTHYISMSLLGKQLSYTTDVSQAGCGCNAAMYLVPMRRNPLVSGCFDHYCDANTVCGVNCHEIDIQEANKHAWHSALHKEWDGNGIAAGYGGWVHNNNRYDFNGQQYGPGGKCIDTRAPFRVTASFPVGGNGMLKHMKVELSQNGKPCTVSLTMDRYEADPGFQQLTRALEDGMTPVVSYWKAADMLWLDGPGVGGGPCKEDTQACGTAPQFYGFSLESL